MLAILALNARSRNKHISVSLHLHFLSSVTLDTCISCFAPPTAHPPPQPQLEGLAPWPLQLGPEFIHGDENNVLKEFIDAQGWKCRSFEWPDRRGLVPRPNPRVCIYFKDSGVYGLWSTAIAVAWKLSRECLRLKDQVPPCSRPPFACVLFFLAESGLKSKQHT